MELDGKRVLIDARLEAMNAELGRVTDLLAEFESQRGAKLDTLTGVLRQQREGIAELNQTTQGLREALSSSKARGQWGERMAEDVLQLAGFVEGCCESLSPPPPPHEATAMAEQFLDRSLSAGRKVAFIIHGHGTGALRDAVRETLRVSSYVEKSRPGEPREGGDGVTVVWLKW